MHNLDINAVRSEALFVSALQRSDEPSVGQIHAAIRRSVRELGSRGCAARVAQEFGDHPEIAVTRMLWAREAVGGAFRAGRAEVDAATLVSRRAQAHAHACPAA